MERDHPGEVAEVREEVLAEAAEVEAEWKAIAPEPALVGTAFAPAVGQQCPINWLSLLQPELPEMRHENGETVG